MHTCIHDMHVINESEMCYVCLCKSIATLTFHFQIIFFEVFEQAKATRCLEQRRGEREKCESNRKTEKRERVKADRSDILVDDEKEINLTGASRAGIDDFRIHGVAKYEIVYLDVQEREREVRKGE